MKNFSEWLKEREMNESGVVRQGALPLLGAFKAGPLGYQIGRGMEKALNDPARRSRSGEAPYRYNKEEDDKQPWYNKDLMQYVPGTFANREKKDALAHDAKKAKDKKDVDDLISKGWSSEDALNWVRYYRDNTERQKLDRYYKQKYPNYFAGQ